MSLFPSKIFVFILLPLSFQISLGQSCPNSYFRINLMLPEEATGFDASKGLHFYAEDSKINIERDIRGKNVKYYACIPIPLKNNKVFTCRCNSNGKDIAKYDYSILNKESSNEIRLHQNNLIECPINSPKKVEGTDKTDITKNYTEYKKKVEYLDSIATKLTKEHNALADSLSREKQEVIRLGEEIDLLNRKYENFTQERDSIIKKLNQEIAQKKVSLSKFEAYLNENFERFCPSPKKFVWTPMLAFNNQAITINQLRYIEFELTTERENDLYLMGYSVDINFFQRVNSYESPILLKSINKSISFSKDGYQTKFSLENELDTNVIQNVDFIGLNLCYNDEFIEKINIIKSYLQVDNKREFDSRLEVEYTMRKNSNSKEIYTILDSKKKK